MKREILYKIGEWLDDKRWTINGVSRSSYYEGAVDVLAVAGFKVNEVPCGHSVIHSVSYSTKHKSNQMEVKYE